MEKGLKVYAETIENNCDNLQILKIVNYLIGTIISDVDYMNDYDYNDVEYFDLGNNNTINKEDFECLVSIRDNIMNVIEDNK